jgi:hypothetical protein
VSLQPPRRSVIPIYTSRGDAEAFLVYPHLYNRLGEWIGWVTADRQVFSVLGYFVGNLTTEPRIICKRFSPTLIPQNTPPERPPHLDVPATIPLAPMMSDLPSGWMDVLLEEPELLHTLDSGELREDLD